MLFALVLLAGTSDQTGAFVEGGILLMRRHTLVFAVVAVAAVVLAGVQSAAQVTKGKERVLQTKSWMAGVNGPHCSALGKMLKAGLSEEKQWSEAIQHAEILNESGHVLMADSRCPDKVWADASAQLREGSEQLLTALQARNASDAQTAFNDQVLKSCSSCHSAHKK